MPGAKQLLEQIRWRLIRSKNQEQKKLLSGSYRILAFCGQYLVSVKA